MYFNVKSMLLAATVVASAVSFNSRAELPPAFGPVEDPNLRACIEQRAASYGYERPEDFSILHCDEVSSLDGLQQLVNLDVLSLGRSDFDDLSPVNALVGLGNISLKWNTSNDLTALRNNTSLLSIDYLGAQNPTPESMAAIAQLPQLNRLELGSLDDEAMDVSRLSALSSLRALMLSGIEVVNAQALAA